MMSPRTAGTSVDPPSVSLEHTLTLIASVVSLVLVAVALATTTADPDLWGHVRFGHDIVASRSIPAVDAYSFTSDRPWINHEWLAEVIAYGAYSLAGPVGLVVLRLTLVLGTLAAVARSLAIAGLRATHRHVLLLVATSGMFLRMQAVRPQLFSFLLFAWMLVIVRSADAGRRGGLLAVPLIFAAWANLHGGWIVGLAIWLAWCGWTLIQGDWPARQRGRLVLLAVASVLATLVTPYGLRLWQFLWETVGWSRPDIRDWQPIYLVSAGVYVPWTLLTMATVAGVVSSTRPRRVVYAATSLLLALGASRVSRLDAFFALATVSLLGQELTDVAVRAWRRVAGEDPAYEPGRVAPRLAAWLITGVTAASVGGAAVLSVPGLDCVRMAGDWLPEREAGLLVQSGTVSGRMITWFSWGEYAIWFGRPGLHVSLDGRRETVYSDAVVGEQLAFARGDAAAAASMERYGADWIWLPTQAAVLPSLITAGWHVAFAGPTSSLLSRQPGPFVMSGAPGPGRRCFPGP